MKFNYLFVALAVLALAGVKGQTKSDFEKYKGVCLQETKSTPEELKKFLDGGLKPEDATDPIKCYLKCMLEETGQLGAGKFSEQAIIKLFDEFPNLSERKQELAKAVADCRGVMGGPTACDTAYKIIMCFKDHNGAEIALTEF